MALFFLICKNTGFIRFYLCFVKRFFIELRYFGKNYHGWQIQPNAITVQEVLDAALSKLLKIPIQSMGQGRTDTGVHATQFFAHFDSPETLPVDFQKALQGNLPIDISIQNIFEVHPEAHARFSAIARSYEYHICTYRNPFQTDLSWFIPYPLQLEHLNAGLNLLLGDQDFSSFCKSNVVVNNFRCCVTEARLEVLPQKLIFHFTANRFLRNMVRAMVGTLVELGREKITLEQFQQIIFAHDRTQAGASAPAHGLFLTRVTYPSWVNPQIFPHEMD